MSLQDVEIKNEYRSLLDHVAKDFYIPLLREAVSYKRAVGFFSSSSLVEISKGIAALVKNGGKIFLVASPYLSTEDVEAIRKGYELRDCIIKKAVVRELKEAKNVYEQERLNLLANIISEGILDIKIAFTEDKNKMGMYHEKMGIISDKFGNKVAFAGSMNESAAAMTLNYETIDVFCSWKGDYDRVATKENAFVSIWNDCEPNIRIIDFPNLKREIIDRYKKSVPDYDIDKYEFDNKMYRLEKTSVYRLGPTIPQDIKLHDYQIEAINEWEKCDYRGIFDMATGTGKTFTGLGAISKIAENLNDDLAVIIVCPYQHLVEQWVEDIVSFRIKPIIGYSSSSQKDWKKRLTKAIRDKKLRQDKQFFCFICTNATFMSSFVQDQLSRMVRPLLLVVDEAHNFGAKNLSKLLDERFTYRLALSATLDRYRDEEGTAALYQFFGKKCIEYSLDRAIQEKKLTPYKYHPVIVCLTEEELQGYEQLSYEMSKHLIKDKNGKYKLNKYGEILALKRARIVAGASGKLDALREKMKPFVHDHNLLVYCGATNVLDGHSDFTDTNKEDIRQIEAVTKILGNELNMSVAQFTSQESVEQRAIIKEQFQRGDRLQAIVAIKCLDEGVNIPGIRTAFILASTTNPKEYIQRRGRVLRKAPNKDFAEIFDFVTLPRPLDVVSSLTEGQAERDKTLIKNELARIREFGRLSLNPMESNNLIWDIEETYHIVNSNIAEEGDF